MSAFRAESMGDMIRVLVVLFIYTVYRLCADQNPEQSTLKSGNSSRQLLRASITAEIT